MAKFNDGLPDLTNLESFIDPEKLKDKLPQPYRMIDTILQSIITDAIFISERRKMRNEEQSHESLLASETPIVFSVTSQSIKSVRSFFIQNKEPTWKPPPEKNSSLAEDAEYCHNLGFSTVYQDGKSKTVHLVHFFVASGGQVGLCTQHYDSANTDLSSNDIKWKHVHNDEIQFVDYSPQSVCGLAIIVTATNDTVHLHSVVDKIPQIRIKTDGSFVETLSDSENTELELVTLASFAVPSSNTIDVQISKDGSLLFISTANGSLFCFHILYSLKTETKSQIEKPIQTPKEEEKPEPPLKKSESSSSARKRPGSSGSQDQSSRMHKSSSRQRKQSSSKEKVIEQVEIVEPQISSDSIFVISNTLVPSSSVTLLYHLSPPKIVRETNAKDETFVFPRLFISITSNDSQSDTNPQSTSHQEEMSTQTKRNKTANTQAERQSSAQSNTKRRTTRNEKRNATESQTASDSEIQYVNCYCVPRAKFKLDTRIDNNGEYIETVIVVWWENNNIAFFLSHYLPTNFNSDQTNIRVKPGQNILFHEVVSCVSLKYPFILFGSDNQLMAYHIQSGNTTLPFKLSEQISSIEFLSIEQNELSTILITLASNCFALCELSKTKIKLLSHSPQYSKERLNVSPISGTILLVEMADTIHLLNVSGSFSLSLFDSSKCLYCGKVAKPFDLQTEPFEYFSYLKPHKYSETQSSLNLLDKQLSAQEKYEYSVFKFKTERKKRKPEPFQPKSILGDFLAVSSLGRKEREDFIKCFISV